MNANNAFQRIWVKYSPLITLKLKQAISKNEAQAINVDKFDFSKAVTGKNNSAFSFTLEYYDGIARNSMKLPAAARELAAVLNENAATKEMIKSGHFTFKMGSTFILSIQKH